MKVFLILILQRIVYASCIQLGYNAMADIFFMLDKMNNIDGAPRADDLEILLSDKYTDQHKVYSI